MNTIPSQKVSYPFLFCLVTKSSVSVGKDSELGQIFHFLLYYKMLCQGIFNSFFTLEMK